MLTGIHPLLIGELLWRLDEMGHSDAIVISDAHFPAPRGGQPGLVFPSVSAPDLIRAIVTVLPLDDPNPLDLMETPDGLSTVQAEMLSAAGVTEREARVLNRTDFYRIAAAALLVVRTGETRPYGNLILRKGLVVPTRGD